MDVNRYYLSSQFKPPFKWRQYRCIYKNVQCEMLWRGMSWETVGNNICWPPDCDVQWFYSEDIKKEMEEKVGEMNIIDFVKFLNRELK